MERRLRLEILAQPDDTTCGPTCLHAVYSYYGAAPPLERLIAEVPTVEGGGTLGVMLGCHALRQGFRASIYTYNLQVFDPTWFQLDVAGLRDRLAAQARHKRAGKLQAATEAYQEFLGAGGEVHLRDLEPRLLAELLDRELPVLTGLSATYLYRTSRELADGRHDDARGEPVGHFVVLCGMDAEHRRVLVADPMSPNPVADSQTYAVDVHRVIGAILLGVLTFDANLLVIEPPRPGS